MGQIVNTITIYLLLLYYHYFIIIIIIILHADMSKQLTMSVGRW